MAKSRTQIPPPTAAAVLFEADRTCGVCRKEGKPVQIHHIDGNPTNHDQQNLAALCLDCHHQTQLTGGFARKLDEHQIRLYRDSWNQAIAARRSIGGEEDEANPSGSVVLDAELATSIVEINREAENHINLAMFYDSIGNEGLRDKEIEQAVQEGLPDTILIRLRRLQGRLNEVPAGVVRKRLDRLEEKSAFSAGGIYEDLGDHRRGAEAYIKGLSEKLGNMSDFTLAFGLKRLAESSVTSGLFLSALQKAGEEDDLWWQVRALEELEWTSQLHSLILESRDKIETAALPKKQRARLRVILAEALDDQELLRESRLEYEKIQASTVGRKASSASVRDGA